MGRKGTGNKHKCWAQDRQGEVKNSIGNEKLKAFMYTHGYELRGGRGNTGVGIAERWGIKGIKKLGQL